MPRWLPLLLSLGLAACAAVPEPRDGIEAPAAPGAADAPAGESAAGAVRHRVDNRAVALLWARAEQARREDRLDDAVAALERALQLEPEDAVLWSRLAELRLRQADYDGAEGLAAKSNALAGEQRLLRYRNWLIIAEARARRGDEPGAREARARADALRGS